MATFSALTLQQQHTLIDYSAVLRTGISQLSRSLNQLNAINNSYLATASAALQALDSGEVVTDTTGFAGAIPLLQSDLITLTSHIEAALAIYDAAHQQIWVKACGPSNLI